MNKQEAYDLVEKHYRKNFKGAASKYGEDAVQETYLSILEDWKTIKSVGVNRMFNQMLPQKKVNEYRKSRPLSGYDQIEEATDQTPEQEVITKQELESAIKKIDAITNPAHSAMIKMFFVEQMSQKNIAYMFDTSTDNVIKIVQRFRKTL